MPARSFGKESYDFVLIFIDSIVEHYQRNVLTFATKYLHIFSFTKLALGICSNTSYHHDK
jgi:hypothetical protein